MADNIVARGGDSNDTKFSPHPIGQFSARCVDVIGLGEKVDQYGDQPTKLVHKVVLVFHTTENHPDGTRRELSSPEYTVSMGEKANLRHFLEAWRGRPYTEEQVAEGVPLGKLAGQTALVSVTHKVSRKGRTYASIQSIMPLPKAMPAPLEADYQRAPYWDEKKQEYAKARQDYLASVAPPLPSDDDEFPDAPDDGGDGALPF